MNFASATLESMDPAFAKELFVMWTVHNVYNTLLETNENGLITPSLAKDWECSANGLDYTFHLETKVYFQDNEAFPYSKGRKMVAQDVVYSFYRLIDPATASPGAWIFNEKVDPNNAFTVLNDSTFCIHLLKPFRPLLQMLSMPYCAIVPHEVVQHYGKDFRSHPCGTGPFKLHYWDEGNSLVLYKNPTYWQHDSSGVSLPYLDAVQISFYDSKSTEFLLFLQHKLDWVNGVDASFKDQVLSKNGTLKKEYVGQFNLEKGTYFNTEYIGFMLDTNLLQEGTGATRNLYVRQAINYAIDRQKIITYFRNGLGKPALSGFIPYGMPGYDSAHSFGYSYRPDLTKQLLAKAGYPDGKGLPEITIISPPNWADIVNFIVNELAEVGIKAKVDLTQANMVKQQMSRCKAPAFRAQWIADYPDAESYLVCFNGNYPAPPNYTRFNDSTYNHWYNESLNAPDSLRFVAYRKMDSLAMSYAPLVPIYYDMLLHFIQNNVSGLHSNAMNIIDLKHVHID
jgi:peptide/nickel transport system substrate-binding protein